MGEIVFLVALGFLLGGILKGATGAGAPLIAVPLLTLFYDVQTAIVLFSIPNLIPNIWQSWRYRGARLPFSFLGAFALAGSAGTIVGTLTLVRLPADTLAAIVAIVVLFYVVFRLFNPEWKLPFSVGNRVAGLVGGLAGTLQGASGISAPVSISFLNALRLDRDQFISTISVYFCAVAIVQIPMLVTMQLMTVDLFWLSCAALVPLFAGMPVGNWLTRHLSPEQFDRILLLVLAVLGVRLLFSVV